MAAWFRRRDKQGLFNTCPFQEAPSPPMSPELAEACERAMHVVTTDGRLLRAGRATMFLFEHTGCGWIAKVWSYPPMVWPVEVAYWIFARCRPFFALFLFRREYDD